VERTGGSFSAGIASFNALAQQINRKVSKYMASKFYISLVSLENGLNGTDVIRSDLGNVQLKVE
jgi:hypothetical protein